MSNIIADGLPLGLHFYDTLGKQKKYQYDCRKGVSHWEYQYTDECTLPPWQIVRSTNPLTDIDVYIICADTGEEFDMDTYCPDLISDITIKTIGNYDYIIYPAGHSCCNLPFSKTLVYLRVEDGTNYFYSEFFWIDSQMEDVDTYYRLWTPSDYRTHDSIDLRIWT